MYLCGKITYKETLFLYMRKIFTLFSALGMMVASSLQAADWATDLVTLNPEVIDSVKFLPAEGSFYDTYLIYYHQPLLHEQPELGSLPERADVTRYNLMGQPTDKAQGLSIENGRVIFKK